MSIESGFYLMNDYLIYVIGERSYTWGNDVHMGYDFINLGEICDGVMSKGNLAITWFNFYYTKHLDKPTKKEFNEFFNYILTKEKEFSRELLNMIEHNYPNILYKFPTLSQIRDKKINSLL